MNPGARYESLAMYDQRDTNGTELRAVAGNFLFSTGANEFAGRYTAGHFDLPMMGTTIELDGVARNPRRRAAGRVRVVNTSLRGAKRRSNPVPHVWPLDCFASLAMTTRGFPHPSLAGRARPKCRSMSTSAARRFSR